MIHTDGRTTIANRVERQLVSESEFERKLDLHVVRRLANDSRYRFAENAEAQSEAEETIERETVEYLLCHYRAAGVSDALIAPWLS